MSILFSTLHSLNLAEANPGPVYSLEMPEEYLNYTVSRVNGSLWAIVDGTYPLSKITAECRDQPYNGGYTFSEDSLPIVYPTPPGTTDITLKMDGTELAWNNFTEVYPEATHYTALGDWPMISSVINVPDQFVLQIHYKHPIVMVNGSYTFLYDLNISPYLSPWSNKSKAHFDIRFETGYRNLQVNTVAVDGTLEPVNYVVTNQEDAETVTLQIVSEFSKPLLGDLLISFSENNDLEHTNSGILDKTLQGYTLIAVTLATATILGYIFLKHKKLR